MSSRTLFIALPAALLILGSGAANAGTTIAKVGAMACINDKWNESEPDKDHKLVDYGGRCVHIPDNQAVQAMSAEDCIGSYEYMPDKTWKGAGTCTVVFKDGDKLYESWEEGSHLKESTFKITGGTGKYQGATGSGTYVYELLTDTLSGGRYKGTIELP